MKLFAFLKAQVASGERQPYAALVIELANFGFFVDVSELGLSGLVHLSSIADDFFVFDPARGQLTGRRARRVIRVGDRLTVQVDKVETNKKQVDFRLVPAAVEPKGRKRPVKAALPEQRSDRGRRSRDNRAPQGRAHRPGRQRQSAARSRR